MGHKARSPCAPFLSIISLGRKLSDMKFTSSLPALTDAAIHGDVFGSDHCPVSVEIDFSQKTAPEA